MCQEALARPCESPASALGANTRAEAGWQYRPDNPRLRKGKPAKYEMPVGQSNVIDVPPGVGGWPAGAPCSGSPAFPARTGRPTPGPRARRRCIRAVAPNVSAWVEMSVEEARPLLREFPLRGPDRCRVHQERRAGHRAQPRRVRGARGPVRSVSRPFAPLGRAPCSGWLSSYPAPELGAAKVGLFGRRE